MKFRTDTLCGYFHERAREMGEEQPFLMGRFDEDGDPAANFRTLTWKDARRQCLELASGLLALGVKRGKRSRSSPRAGRAG